MNFRLPSLLMTMMIMICAAVIGFVSVSSAASAANVSKDPGNALHGGQAVALRQLEKHVLNNRAVDQDTVRQISEILKEEPHNAHAHYVAGEIFLRCGYDQLAEQEFKESDRLEPSQPNALIELFTDKIAHDDLAGASQYLLYLRQRFPNDPNVLLMEGIILEARKPQYAEAFYTQAAKMAAPGSGVRTALGQIRLRQGRAVEALALAQEDLSAKPNYVKSMIVAGEALCALHRTKEGVDLLRRAYENDPLDEKFVKDYAEYLDHAGMYSAAMEPALIYMAQCTQPQLLVRAKERVRDLVAQVPRSETLNIIDVTDRRLNRTAYQSRMHLAMGDVFDSFGNYSDAVEQYQQGLLLDPTVARGYLRLARDLEHLRKYGDAFIKYKKAADLGSGNKMLTAAFQDYIVRIDRRRQNDIAWRLKDWMRQHGL